MEKFKYFLNLFFCAKQRGITYAKKDYIKIHLFPLPSETDIHHKLFGLSSSLQVIN